jgi:hypothetical protein
MAANAATADKIAYPVLHNIAAVIARAEVHRVGVIFRTMTSALLQAGYANGSH